MRLLSSVLAGCVSLSAIGCGLDTAGAADLLAVTGGDDDGGNALHPDSGNGLVDGSVQVDGGSADSSLSQPDDGGGNTGNDSSDAPVTEAGPDGCGAIEICNNGVDDDCDNAVDCADSDCTAGWKCTGGSVPSGWSIVEYVMTARPSCSTGYATVNDVLEGPTGPAATCGCSCALSPGSCQKGNFNFAGDALAGGACGMGIDISANDGNCHADVGPYTTHNGSKAQVKPAPYTPGSCAAAATKSVAPITYAGQGRACTESATLGGGCTGGAVCAPSPTAPFGLCIYKGGDQPCPTGFGAKHLVGTSASDGRGCSTCTCLSASASGGTCSKEKLTLFTDLSCTQGATDFTVDSKCDDVSGNGQSFAAYEYTATLQGETCGAAGAVTPTGGVTLNGLGTICCQ